MRLYLLSLLIGAMCLALVNVQPVHAKPKKVQTRVQKKEKAEPNTVLKIVDLNKAKKKAIKKLQKAVKKVEGVTNATAVKKANELKVWHEPEVERAALVAAVESAGFKVAEEEPAEEPAEPEEEEYEE